MKWVGLVLLSGLLVLRLVGCGNRPIDSGYSLNSIEDNNMAVEPSSSEPVSTAPTNDTTETKETTNQEILPQPIIATFIFFSILFISFRIVKFILSHLFILVNQKITIISFV